MSSSRQFVIMSLHGGQKYYHEVCANYLLYSAISSSVSGKGSRVVFVNYLLQNVVSFESQVSIVTR